jgi:hypothetical protein
MSQLSHENLDRFIKITEAADILGYAHYRSVIMLIERKLLTAYKLPHVVRKRVLLSDVLKLKESSNEDEDGSENNSTEKRGRGRPRKFG